MTDKPQSKVKKYIMRAVLLCLFFAGAILIYFVLDYFLTDDTSSMTRVSSYDYYQQDNIDILFIGTSHAISAVNAQKLSEDLGKDVFLRASMSQEFVEAYYYILDTLESHDIEHVYCELSASKLKASGTADITAYIVTDYLENFRLKSEMLLTLFKPEKYINSFLRLRRSIDPLNLPTWSDIKELYKKKQSAEYKTYSGTGSSFLFQYIGLGQWFRKPKWAETPAVNINSQYIDNLDQSRFKDIAIEYLQKIVDLCKERNVPLTFYILPYTDAYLILTDHYEETNDYIKEFCSSQNVDLIDFNRVKPEYYSAVNSEFSNHDHIATASSDKIADFLETYMADPDRDYFYDTIEDRYSDKQKIYAVGVDIYCVTETGEYHNTYSDNMGRLTDLHLIINAVSYEDRPAYAKMWKVEKNPDTKEWELSEEIAGEKVDEYRTGFVVPYDSFETIYYIQLFDPETDEQIYETSTNFYLG